MAEIITTDVLTLTEVKTLTGQSSQAILIYDVSTGEPKGLDVEILINMDSSISGKADAVVGKSLVSDSSIAEIHPMGGDTTLGAMTANVNMNSHKMTGLSVPSANGDSIRATAKITEALLESATDLKHTSGNDSTLKSPDLTKSINLDNAGVLHVESISQVGSSYETHAEQVYTTKDEIILRDGAVAGLATGAFVGIRAKLYDGVNDGRLVFDKDGFARVGDVGYELKIATIQETPTDSQFTYYDAATLSLKTRAIALSHLPSGLVLTAQTVSQTIGATGSRLTKLWAVDGEFTNMPTVGGVGILSSLTDPSFSSVEVGTFGSPSDYGAGGTARVLIADNYNAPSGVQMYNSNAGTSADFRFTVFNTAKNQYISISTPGDGNTLTLFGSIRSTSNYIFNNTATGGTARDLTIGTIGGTALIFGTNNIVRMRILSSGNIGFGLTSPTAVTHFKAGSATAGTAPAKYNSGTLMTTPEVGAFEFNTDAFYGTITTGAVRRMFIMSQTGRAVGQTAANANVHSFTLSAADGSYQICANVLVTTSSAEAFTVIVAYTDEGNTARTATMTFQLVNGTIGTNIAFANGAVPYMGHPLNIRCKASTAITVATTGTFTGCTYNVETIFKKVA